MRHITPYEIFESDNSDELLNSLKRLSGQLDKLKSYGQHIGRVSTVSKSNSQKLADEYEEYFYSVMDDGWKYYRSNDQFHMEISLKKPIRKEDAEKELPHIVDEMTEVKNRFTDVGFNCHFLIDYDGIGQQETNPATYRSDVYKFKGIGDRNLFRHADEKEYPVSLYPREEFFMAKIRFVYI